MKALKGTVKCSIRQFKHALVCFRYSHFALKWVRRVLHFGAHLSIPLFPRLRVELQQSNQGVPVCTAQLFDASHSPHRQFFTILLPILSYSSTYYLPTRISNDPVHRNRMYKLQDFMILLEISADITNHFHSYFLFSLFPTHQSLSRTDKSFGCMIDGRT